MGIQELSHNRALVVVAAVYTLLIGVAVAIFPLFDDWHPLVATLVVDCVTTAIIFALSCAVHNGSLYDAYWSTAPILIAWGFAVRGTDVPGIRVALVLICVAIWGLRLTSNWARNWPGFKHEDWRYTQMKEETGLPWWAINLTVVHVFPTLQVWTACIGLYAALTLGTNKISVLDTVAVVLIIGGATIELIADAQLRAHRTASTSPCRTGLWSLSRHPNYFGELCAWWGMWCFGVAGHPSAWWWTLVGPVTMTVLLRTASVPMMDKRSVQRRPGYDVLMRELPAILPIGRQIFRRQ